MKTVDFSQYLAYYNSFDMEMEQKFINYFSYIYLMKGIIPNVTNETKRRKNQIIFVNKCSCIRNKITLFT